MPYIVTYASAGCLPDSEPMEFPTLELASAHVVEEFDRVAAELESDGITCPILTGLDVMPAMGATDPTPGSLYRWTIEEVARDTAIESMLTDTFYGVAADCDLHAHIGSTERRNELSNLARSARAHARAVESMRVDYDHYRQYAHDLQAQARAAIERY